MAAKLSDFRHISSKIVCVARNYAKHVEEMHYRNPAKPVLFIKAPNSYLSEGEGKIETPEGCKLLHHELELGVVIAKKARWLKKEDAMAYVGGYTIALDMTARDLQEEAKKAGLPWFVSKAFDTSCAVGGFIEASAVPDYRALQIYCKVNGTERQRASASEMLFDIPTALEYITKFVTLERGDLVLTGTPDGVGPCLSGDELEIGVEGKLKAKFSVK